MNIIPDWFFTNKMIKKLFTSLNAFENTLYFNEDFGNVEFNCDEIGILNIDLNNINLDDNFDENDPDTIILIRLLAWHIKFEKPKGHRKNKSDESMPIAWHPKRW